jgi:hypothetical protein
MGIKISANTVSNVTCSMEGITATTAYEAPMRNNQCV